MSDAAAGATVDPGALIRTREYRRLLVVAAVIGGVVPLVSWGFLELVGMGGWTGLSSSDDATPTTS